MTYKPYAGIGSRETPLDVLSLMTDIAIELANYGFTLRSGGADGADSAFEIGAGDGRLVKEIYLPWAGFNGSRSHLYLWPTPDLQAEAETIAARHHPAWERCSQGARKMHTRNVAQVLGEYLNQPALCVICWTPNGSGTGGTGQALRIAKTYGVPIFDLGLPDRAAVLEALKTHLNALL